MAQTATYETAQAKGYETPCAETEQGQGDTGMSEHDKWLCGNPVILDSVKQGLADSAAGRVSKRKSYAEHANDILED